MFSTLSDAESDFHQAFEPVEALKPGDAWHALLTNAGRPMARPWTPHTADDYVIFEISRTLDALLVASLERRIAQYTDDGDYDGTAILGCHLTLQDDDEWRKALPDPRDRWWAEGHVSAYQQLEGIDDRPSMEAFRNQIEASPLFADFCRAVITHVRLAPRGSTQ
ncbi:MAG: hypothetical protein ABW167_05400 [Baekduia sp.]